MVYHTTHEHGIPISYFYVNPLLSIPNLKLTMSNYLKTFTITNNCSFTVWAAAIPGGGQQLNQGQTWFINASSGTMGRIWARTGCKFNEYGQGSCQTGDCNGQLKCQTYGSPPNTLAEYTLSQNNYSDFFDMSLVEGFNVPMQFSSISNLCTRDISCVSDIIGQCPIALQAPGGCNNPCEVFKTDQYCCTSSNSSCEPTKLSGFFKNRCPDAYSYPKHDQTSTFTCPAGTNYTVVFCPEPILTKTIASSMTECLRNSTITIPLAKITVVAPASRVATSSFMFLCQNNNNLC
ncbi:thaumatin-like protein 1 [Impatiens glandulifera]|uniref:thaumatin-like protein 1 n=1 Tax=Impatiens glandulifera TaxID=253017 RepID=UPI001FB07CE3|nr:thaumatin-like protein 1 [Impatiens glandulifera]